MIDYSLCTKLEKSFFFSSDHSVEGIQSVLLLVSQLKDVTFVILLKLIISIKMHAIKTKLK